MRAFEANRAQKTLCIRSRRKELAEKLGSAHLSVRLANFEVIICLTFCHPDRSEPGFASVGMTECGAEGTSTFAVRDGRLDQIIEFLRKL
jgi:hypothetical protein